MPGAGVEVGAGLLLKIVGRVVVGRVVVGRVVVGCVVVGRVVVGWATAEVREEFDALDAFKLVSKLL